MEENANNLHFYRLYLCYSYTNFDIFSVYNREFFPILIANKIFHVTVLLLVYFCDQFVALEFRHSRCHNSVCQKHVNTLRVHSYTHIGIKTGALKIQFVCIFTCCAVASALC